MTKPRTMPVHDGSRSDQYERLPPPGPARLQRNPEPLVQGRQSTARSLRVQSQQLLTKGEVFKDKVLPGTKSADHRPEEMPERRVSCKNPSGKLRIVPCTKSFILWVYDVLAKHRPRLRESRLPAAQGSAHGGHQDRNSSSFRKPPKMRSSTNSRADPIFMTVSLLPERKKKNPSVNK